MPLGLDSRELALVRREGEGVSETFDAFCLDMEIRGRKRAFRDFLAGAVYETTIDDLSYGELKAMLPLFLKHERDLAASLAQQQAGSRKRDTP